MNYLVNIKKGLYGLVFMNQPIILTNLIEKKVITDDTWNKFPNGQIVLTYYLNENDMQNKKHIAYMSYRVFVGQIGVFVINEEYRNRGLGKQILNNVIDHMKYNGVTQVWAVTTFGHPFWSNVYNKSFTFRKPASYSVTGSGYYMPI